MIVELPDDSPTPECNSVDSKPHSQNEGNPSKKLKEKLRVERLKRKSPKALVRNLPNLAPGARRLAKLSKKVHRTLPVKTHRDTESHKVVKSSKSLNKKGQTEPKILKKPRVERLIPREQVTKNKAWIIDTTSRAEDESLEWLNHLDFTAMGEGFLCVKTHLGQVSELNRLARQWGAKFVNTECQ